MSYHYLPRIETNRMLMIAQMLYQRYDYLPLAVGRSRRFNYDAMIACGH
jgi:hypothetical protein